MSQFDSVSVVKKANVYFDGKVTSRTVVFPSGEKKTLGIMMVGEYEFGTNEAEIMEILSGECEVQLPHESLWKKVVAPNSFDVPANSKFKIKAVTLVDYCCSFIR